MARNLEDLIPAVFTGPNGQPLTEDQIRSRQLIARTLLQNATDTSPNAGGWASVLAKGVQGFASGYQNRAADRGAQAATKADSDLSSALLGSLSGGSIPSPGASGELSSSSPAVIPQNADASYIRQGLIERGLPEHVADGFLVNFQDESGLNPGINEANPTVPGSRGGFGLYQLTGPRRTAYEAFAKDRGTDPSNVDAQLDFLKYELSGPEANAGKAIMAAPDTATAAQAILNNFLRPAPEYRASRAAKYAGLPTQVASAAPQTATDAIAAVSPTSGYSDPTVTTAYAQPAPTPVTSAPISPVGQMQTVADPTVAPAQNISPVAQALMAPTKGDRLGSPPAISQGSFDDRFGGVPQQAAPEIYSQPQDFNQSSQAPAQAPIQSAPQAIPQATPQAALSQPQLPSVPPLNPAVIKALSSPYASPQTKQVASALLQQHQQQVQNVQEQRLKIQQQQQALQQRQTVAQTLGIDPTLAADDEAWKQAVGGGSLINAGDGNLYDSRTRQWIRPPSASDPKFRQATPEEIQRYGVNGQVDQEGKFYPITPPRGTSITVGADGALQFNEGAGVTQRAPTEAQAKDAFFTTRMTAASPTLDKFEKNLLSPDQVAADYVPGGRYYQSEEYQLARDAGDDFVAGYLRKDSGAALTDEERSQYGKMLLPQPGDKPAIIDAKRQRRQIAIEAIKSGLPPSSVDSVLKAIQAVPGADKPAMTTEEKNVIQTDIPGVIIRRKN